MAAMDMTVTSVSLPNYVRTKLDEVSTATGYSKSQIMRRALIVALGLEEAEK